MILSVGWCPGERCGSTQTLQCWAYAIVEDTGLRMVWSNLHFRAREHTLNLLVLGLIYYLQYNIFLSHGTMKLEAGRRQWLKLRDGNQQVMLFFS